MGRSRRRWKSRGGFCGSLAFAGCALTRHDWDVTGAPVPVMEKVVWIGDRADKTGSDLDTSLQERLEVCLGFTIGLDLARTGELGSHQTVINIYANGMYYIL